jgi:hypothetical protein
MKSLIVPIIGMAFIVALSFVNSAIECHAKWSEAKYNPLSGCMVNTHDGFIPESNVTVLHWTNQEDEIE